MATILFLEKHCSKKSMKKRQKTTDPSKPLASGKENPKSLKPDAVNMKRRPSEDSVRSKEATGSKKLVGIKKNKKKVAASSKPSSSPQNLPSSSKPRAVVPETSSAQEPAKLKEFEIIPSQAGNEHEKKDTRLGGKSEFNGRHVEQRGRSNRNDSRKSSSKYEEEKRREDRKQKVGGIIFMCNSKTKPDCFNYRVMAVPAGKKEIIMGIRPGLKLFLYDFDLKLLYGIYEAASTGGMMLEPKAFGGGFPAQVRFRILKDCQPLSERVFKKAIIENYDEKNKFKTELTIKQVEKLSSLFYLDHSTSTEHPAAPTPRAPAPRIDAGPSVVPYNSKPLFLTEKEYRSYGLRPELHGLPQSTLLNVSPLESRKSGKKRELILRNPASSHLNATSIPNGSRYTSDSESLFPSEQEYRMYGLRAHRESAALVPPPTTQPAIGIASNEDRYRTYSYTGTAVSSSTINPYIPHLGREAYASESLFAEHGNSYHVPVRPSDERLLHTTGYTLQQSSQYNPRSEVDYASAPVSSRYSFNGASYR